MNSVDRRAGLVTAVSCWVAVLAALWLHLGDPWWAAISAWVIANVNLAKIWQKGALRLVGTVVGCVVGYELACRSEGSQMVQSAWLFALTAGGLYLRFRSDYQYGFMIMTVSALMIMSVSMEAGSSIYVAAQSRAFEIGCGVVSGTLCPVLLGPLLGWRREAAPADPLRPGLPGEHASALRLGLVGGGTVVLLALLWSWFALPSLTQSLVSPIVVLNRDVASSHFRAGLRFLGCLAGGGAGLVCAVIVGDSFVLWSALFVVGMMFLARLHLSSHRWAYFGTQGGVAFVLAMVTGNGPPETITPVINRLAGMMIGLAVTLVVVEVVRFFSSDETEAAMKPTTG